MRKRFTEQVKLEEARFRQWEQHVSMVCRVSGVVLIPETAYCGTGSVEQGSGECAFGDQAARGGSCCLLLKDSRLTLGTGRGGRVELVSAKSGDCRSTMRGCFRGLLDRGKIECLLEMLNVVYAPRLYRTVCVCIIFWPCAAMYIRMPSCCEFAAKLPAAEPVARPPHHLQLLLPLRHSPT